MKKVFLPQTDFPIRAQLPQNEPKVLDYWSGRWRGSIDLYALRAAQGGEPFVLHDGPPYANGNIHIGHALNKILKDFVVRTRYLLGHSVAFTPGWDCHGLPIEWEVEKQYRAEGKDRNDDPEAFRTSCRNYAVDWVNKQSEQFQRLGVVADYENRYETSDFDTEAKIVETFHTLVEKGLVYSARRPVLWSAVERTAMAAAETVEQDHQVKTTWVLFPVAPTRSASKKFGGAAFFLVWTTTPWSLPGNTALAVNTTLDYGLYDLDGTPVVMAKFAAHNFPQAVFKQDVDLTEQHDLWTEQDSPDRLMAVHPLYPDKRVPIYHANYVTEGKGSGVVHVGPASSVDDWRLWTKYNPVETVPEFIAPDGRYVDDLPLFGGMRVVKNKGFGEGNDAVIEALGEYLVRTDVQTMTLKHSWRSKCLLIDNASLQWFVRLDQEMIGRWKKHGVRFNPEQSRNRFESMLEGREEWLVSRQRMWGTPMAIFADKDGNVLVDPELNKRVQDGIRKAGAWVWHEADWEVPEGYERVNDVLDVWFDSGCVHKFFGDPAHYLSKGTVLRSHRDALPRADLYLEGTDQHRGWFQSSLLVGMLTDGRPPFRELLTHGFVLDPTGKKMSKSEGNVVDPLQVVQTHGADVLRLWVAMTDYSHDVKVGKDTFKAVEEVYKKLRNTIRYLLGALNGYEPNERNLSASQPLDDYVLAKLQAVSDTCRDAAGRYDFTKYMGALHEFCVHTLSSRYFDVRKDRLYCDPLNGPRRLATLETMSIVFDVLVPLLAPVIVFTAEEAWRARYPEAVSVHLERWPVMGDYAPRRAGRQIEKMESLLKVADSFQPLLDEARKNGVIKGTGEAVITGAMFDLPEETLRELLTASDVVAEIGAVPRVENAVALGYVKCDRCRLFYKELAGEHCSRCETAMEDFDAASVES